MSSDKDNSDKIRKIKVDINEKKKDYEIIIGADLLNTFPEYINKVYKGKMIFLITDENVERLYGEKVRKLFEDTGYELYTYILPPGEKAKSIQYLEKGYDLLLKNGFGRDNLILALGGGVVGDLAGFLAATFMRGIAFVQIPTTLLAQVDSSIGGKTGVNHHLGKNLIGAFYQPELVLIDPVFLKTLALRELKTGLAEVLKYGFIVDKELLNFLTLCREAIFNHELEALTHIIYSSCVIKARIVREDEKEEGKRALLNFGHTIGHALEAVTEYKKYNHGEAVAVGMVGAAELSSRMGFLSEEELIYLKKLIDDYGLPLSCQYGEDKDQVYKRLFFDKKVKDNQLRWVLLKGLGKAYIDEGVCNDLVEKVLEGLG